MRKLLLIPALALLGACGDKTGGAADVTDPSSGIAGTYTLQTVNGTSLPFVTFQLGNDKVEVTAGSAQLNSDNTYSYSITLTDTTAGTVTTTIDTGTGTYTVTGTTIQFSDPGDGSGAFTGSISGNTITVVVDGDTFGFTK